MFRNHARRSKQLNHKIDERKKTQHAGEAGSRLD